MGTRTNYAPGTFSWIDLTTPDPEHAKRFYGELFGWEANDQPAGEGVIYSMMTLGGQQVAGIAPQREEQRAAGVPGRWDSYITVERADETLAHAEQLGATIRGPAFDILDAGRMGALQDPAGAPFLVWQPRRHAGASLVNAPGALAWNELATPDLDTAEGFYGQLFGWTTEPLDDSPVPYRVIRNSEGQVNGGMASIEPAEVEGAAVDGAEGDGAEATERRATERRSTERRVTERRATERRATERRSTERRATERRALEWRSLRVGSSTSARRMPTFPWRERVSSAPRR